MKKILFVPSTVKVETPATFAINFAMRTQSSLSIVSNFKSDKAKSRSVLFEDTIYVNSQHSTEDSLPADWTKYTSIAGDLGTFASNIVEQIPYMDNYVRENGIDIIIKEFIDSKEENVLAIETLLRKIQVPLYLTPDRQLKLPEKLVYLTDLRYCRRDIIKLLLKLTEGIDVEVSIAHVCAPGLPELEQTYASKLFDDIHLECGENDRINFQHIPCQKLDTVVDVMIHGMGFDGIVIANHGAHYQKLIGERLLYGQTGLGNCPLMLFPG